VDWIVQSYWRKHEKKYTYPIYSTRPVSEFFLQSYPHLAGQVDFRILEYGRKIKLDHDPHIHITAYPAYHGQSAFGASMLLFELEDRKILFTGDLLTPLLRKEDYRDLQDLDLLLVDTNNRFPWPRTNHWSFAGDSVFPAERSEVLMEFFGNLDWEKILQPFSLIPEDTVNSEFLKQAGEEWSLQTQPLSIVEFLRLTEPRRVLPVHYSGAEDLKYHGQAILSPIEFADWIQQEARKAGLKSEFVFPEVGDQLSL
jgi:hypothetical protein